MENIAVLFVDNDKIFLQSIKRCLLNEPYHKLFAKSCKEALDILKQEKVHVIVTDIRMPDIDGRELLRIIGKMYPSIVKVVVSGYTNMSILQEEFDNGEIFGFISKPWEDEGDFIKVVREAIDSCNFENESVHPGAGNNTRTIKCE